VAIIGKQVDDECVYVKPLFKSDLLAEDCHAALLHSLPAAARNDGGVK
jgi:hypothetical protein